MTFTSPLHPFLSLFHSIILESIQQASHADTLPSPRNVSSTDATSSKVFRSSDDCFSVREIINSVEWNIFQDAFSTRVRNFSKKKKKNNNFPFGKVFNYFQFRYTRATLYSSKINFHVLNAKKNRDLVARSLSKRFLSNCLSQL